MWVPFKLTYLVCNHYKNGGRGKIHFCTFCDSNESLIFMSKFSMEACPQMNWWSKESKDTIFHIMSQKDQKLNRKLTFDIPKFKFHNGLEQKTSNIWSFLRQTGLWEPSPPTNMQVFLQILNPVSDAEVLAHELVGGQNGGEIVYFHKLFMLMW